ncbi:helix-turn-helix domain-containing protein [Dactylosporangium salmoneum]|uniref:Helix-turn-helix domain-containing protein n=1 Tax=Dactylosporangium salmoneum TaxID=53361 RepID=A0ABN3G8L3_9ACTN
MTPVVVDPLQLLTPKAVAGLMDVDVRTVDALIDEGLLRAIPLGPRTRRIWRADLEAFYVGGGQPLPQVLPENVVPLRKTA